MANQTKMVEMSHLLATTIGTNMLQFLQAVVPHMLSAAGSGTTTSLEVGNGFDIDQISKLKDACGVRNAKQIPPIWAVIQKSKGKMFDTYQAHLTKAMDLWCRMKHIKRTGPFSLGRSSLMTWLPSGSTRGGRWPNTS